MGQGVGTVVFGCGPGLRPALFMFQGSRDKGLGINLGLGFRGKGFGFRVQRLGFRDYRLGIRV